MSKRRTTVTVPELGQSGTGEETEENPQTNNFNRKGEAPAAARTLTRRPLAGAK